MFDAIQRLSAMVSDINRVIVLTGNCGKQVRRVLESYFREGVAECLIPFSQELSPLRFACFVQALQDECEMSNLRLEGEDSSVRLSLEVCPPEEGLSYVTARVCKLSVNCGGVPETVRARQRLLASVDYGLGSVLYILNEIDRNLDNGLLEATFFDGLYADDPEVDTDEDREQLRQSFYRLLDGDFRDIGRVPVAVVDLAARVSPAVTRPLADRPHLDIGVLLRAA